MTNREFVNLLHKEFPECKFKITRINKKGCLLCYAVKEAKDIVKVHSKKFINMLYEFFILYSDELPFEELTVKYDIFGRVIK